MLEKNIKIEYEFGDDYYIDSILDKLNKLVDDLNLNEGTNLKLIEYPDSPETHELLVHYSQEHWGKNIKDSYTVSVAKEDVVRRAKEIKQNLLSDRNVYEVSVFDTTVNEYL